MTGTMRAPRTRGLLSGILLVLLGLWGALLPFVGPYAHFGFAPDDPWVYTAARLQLSVLPGIATVIGGLILLVSANRAIAMFGAWLAVLAGAWFAVGHTLGTLWGLGTAGAPLGTSTAQRVTEQIAGFSGLGVVIVFLSAFALGRFAVVGVRESRRAAVEDAAATLRRVERDLHDGTQQHLVVSTMQLGEAVYWLDRAARDAARSAVRTSSRSSSPSAVASTRGTRPSRLFGTMLETIRFSRLPSPLPRSPW